MNILGTADPGDYKGPFPRNKHTHRCLKCAKRPYPYCQNAGSNCYKAHCTKPQKTADCPACRPNMWTRAKEDKLSVEKSETLARQQASTAYVDAWHRDLPIGTAIAASMGKGLVP